MRRPGRTVAKRSLGGENEAGPQQRSDEGPRDLAGSNAPAVLRDHGINQLAPLAP